MSSSISIETLTPHQRNTLLFIVLAMPLSGAALDIYIPSLPFIVDYFQSTPQLIQLTVAAFVLGFALAQIVFGFVVGRIGRRKVFIYGMFAFMLSCLLTVIATNVETLLFSRFIQGIAIAAPTTTARTLITDIFKGKQLQSHMNTVATSWALGAILAPMIGAALQ